MHKRLIYELNGKLYLFAWLAWNLACMLRTYRIYNSTVRVSKYEFNNKLLSDVTLLRVTPTNSF